MDSIIFQALRQGFLSAFPDLKDRVEDDWSIRKKVPSGQLFRNAHGLMASACLPRPPLHLQRHRLSFAGKTAKWSKPGTIRCPPA